MDLLDIILLPSKIEGGDINAFDDKDNNRITEAIINGKKVATLITHPGQGWSYEMHCDTFHALMREVSGLYSVEKLEAIQRRYPLLKEYYKEVENSFTIPEDFDWDTVECPV